MPITLDFDHVFPPEGEYILECVKAEMKSDKNGYDLEKIQWSIIAPTNAGHIVFDQISFAPAAMAMAQQRLEAMTGIPYRDSNMVVDEKDHPGLRVHAMLVHDEYDGVQQLKVKRMWPNTGERSFPQLEDSVEETTWSTT